MADVITVQSVSKRYRLPSPNRPHTLQEAVVRGFRGIRSKDDFQALDQISFGIAAGKMVGVIGRNGAGKSTLLRLVGGVGTPDSGQIRVQGRLGALLDLGVGFHPELTGRENIYVNAVISGLTRREVRDRLPAIVDFAELGDFLDSPLRTYSTGMQMRLAFSVAAHLDPEILLVDEVLAVGDMRFQAKCLDRIREFKTRGCTILFVSHDLGQVRELCDEAIWLSSGHLTAHGPAGVVANQYANAMHPETRRRTPAHQAPQVTATGIQLQVNQNRFGSQELQISGVRLLAPDGFPTTEMDSGAPLVVEIAFQARTPISSPIFGVTVTDTADRVCYDTSTAAGQLELPDLEGVGKIRLVLERLDLAGGEYFINAGAYKKEWEYAYDYHWRVYRLTIRPTPGEKGPLRPPHRWEFEPSE